MSANDLGMAMILVFALALVLIHLAKWGDEE